MSVTQQVNDACVGIQNSLDNLVEVVESFSSLSARPKLNEAQLRESGSHAQLCTSVVRVSGSGAPMGGVCFTVDDVRQSSTSESARVAQPLSDGSKGVTSPPLCLEDSQTELTNHRNLLVVEGYGGNTGKKNIDIVSGEEETVAVDGCQTSARVRHLRSLWEQGALTVQRRWRSKEGLQIGIDIPIRRTLWE